MGWRVIQAQRMSLPWRHPGQSQTDEAGSHQTWTLFKDRVKGITQGSGEGLQSSLPAISPGPFWMTQAVKLTPTPIPTAT